MDKSDTWRSVTQDLKLLAAKEADAITSNHSEDDAIKDDGKYRYNKKGFLEDDESSDDSILIVDPGCDDYCLQALKLNRPVLLCYNRDKANLSVGTQDVSSNPAGFQDDDSDSDSDEQVILIRNKEPPLMLRKDWIRGIAKCRGTQKRASAKTVPPGSISVPTGSILVPSGDTMVSPSDVLVPTGCIPVPFASTVEVSPVATKRINTVHPQSLIIGEPNSSVQTRSQVHKKTTGETLLVPMLIQDQQRNNHTDFQHCLFACFLSQVEPRSVAQALEDPSWVDAMQADNQTVSRFHICWNLVEISLENQMDVKSAFLYGTIDKEVYVTQPKGFMDPQYPKKVYKKRSTIDKTLFLKKHKRDIILVQVYVDDIILLFTKQAWCDEFEPDRGENLK
ncbi:putative ribonuclease H-like domain-containing protein [Tanacetum coccineum]